MNTNINKSRGLYANYHTHTFRCKHAQGEDREYVEAAIKGGFKVLGFSDHCPWFFDDGHVSGTRMLPKELDGYIASIDNLKKEYKSDITIYVGLEAEYIPELMEKQNKLLQDYTLDYMIIGQHFIQREPYSAYTGFPTEEESNLKTYVDLIIEGMETGRYLYVAHPDLLNFSGSSEIYEKHMLRLCQYLKSKDVPVEINFLGFHGQRHYPSDRFLQIAKKVGNTAIIGVDAHNPDSLLCQMDIEACQRYAENHGLKLLEELPIKGVRWN